MIVFMVVRVTMGMVVAVRMIVSVFPGLARC